MIYEFYEGEIAGFVTGGAGMGPIYRKMLQRIWVWGIPLGIRLISLKRLKRIFDILGYGKGDVFENVNLPDAELYSIAVSPKFRGQGIAPKLYNRLIEYFSTNDIHSFRIVVGDVLKPAHKFYTKMGAMPQAEIEIHKDDASVIYVQDITPSSS